MTEVTRMRWLVFQSMPEHLVRRHSQRKIREDDFSLTSGDVCAPAQTSGVKNIASAIFFTLSKHAARQSGSARRKPGTGFSDAISGALGRPAAQSSGAKNIVSTIFFTL